MTDNRLVLNNLQYFDGLTNRLHQGKTIVIQGEYIEGG